MKSKKIKKPPSNPPAEIIPEDDPYWVISSEHLNPDKGRRNFEKLDKFGQRYPLWVDDLMSGIPTYYSILGVLRGVQPDKLQKCYDREMNFSVYSKETIEEAFRVLSDLQLRIQYDELLHLFKTITAYSDPDEKDTLIKTHSKFLNNARNMRKIGELHDTHHDYIILVGKGMPDIFEYSGLSPGCTDEELIKYSSGSDELSLIISSIMQNSHLREKFIFVTNFFEDLIIEEGRKKREQLKKTWRSFSPELLKSIMMMSLTQNKAFGDTINRINKNISINNDWKNYLPPSETSFFSLLGVEKEDLSLPKGELDALLRSKYRLLNRTSEVNLAYTVLKNPALKEEYLWMRDYYDFKMIDDAITGEKKQPDINELIRKKFENLIRMYNNQNDMFY